MLTGELLGAPMAKAGKQPDAGLLHGLVHLLLLGFLAFEDADAETTPAQQRIKDRPTVGSSRADNAVAIRCRGHNLVCHGQGSQPFRRPALRRGLSTSSGSSRAASMAASKY